MRSEGYSVCRSLGLLPRFRVKKSDTNWFSATLALFTSFVKVPHLEVML